MVLVTPLLSLFHSSSAIYKQNIELNYFHYLADVKFDGQLISFKLSIQHRITLAMGFLQASLVFEGI